MTASRGRKRILFSGYAPVHFLCFQPMYQQLQRRTDVEVWLSGGWRRGEDDEVWYSLAGFYDPFDVDLERVLPIEQARREDFDVLVCAHLSDTLFPRSAKATVQIFHGVSFKNLAVREKALRFDYLCLPGRYHGELYRRAGLIRPSGSRCLLTGFAKVDPLINRPTNRGALLSRLGLDPALPTLLLATTGEKNNALETMGPAVIEALSAARQWNLLVKPHDHPKRNIDWLHELQPLENERVKLVRDPDVVPYLAAADLLLTDASSVAVEYTLLDRPIVFLDVPRLFERVRERSPHLDLDTYGLRTGALARSPSEAVVRVQESLAHPDREGPVRRAMAEHVFYKPGDATERVTGVILHAAGLAPALPDDVRTLLPDAPPRAEVLRSP